MSDYNFFNPQPKPEKKTKEPYKGLKRTAIKKTKKTTGELEFMKSEFDKRGGLCEITSELLEFSPMCCHHLLSKKTYTQWRLEPKNLIIIQPEIHYLYHNASREYLLSLYPEAIVIYDKIEQLKTEYYQPKETI